MDSILSVLTGIRDALWGIPMMVLLLGTGLIFTVRLGFLQLFHLPKAFRMIFEKEEGAGGDVSAFASLCTSLAATIGTGSIVGVATALSDGGPGALFWMWVSAFLGMATKYAESLLAVKYRTIDEKGQYSGGPMYYIEKGLGKKWIPLAKLFAVFAIISGIMGVGTFTQVNAISEVTDTLWHIPQRTVSIIVAVLVGVVIIGGIKSISRFAEFVVPAMAILYIGGSFAVLVINSSALPGVFSDIFYYAFHSYKPMLQGTAAGVLITVMSSMVSGVGRGIFTNEAGLGSSPIVSASAKTNSPVRQGFVSMTGVFITTIVVCTMTGLSILSSGLLGTEKGVVLVSAVFNKALSGFGNIGSYIVAIGIIFFSFTTIIGWSYYGERCCVYLVGSTKLVIPYKLLYVAVIPLTASLDLSLIWTVADITNALMAFPNLIALIGLRREVFIETKSFFSQLKIEKKQKKEARRRHSTGNRFNTR